MYVLPTTPEDHQELVEDLLQTIADNTKAIKGWITFIGVLIIIWLVLLSLGGFLWVKGIQSLF